MTLRLTAAYLLRYGLEYPGKTLYQLSDTMTSNESTSFAYLIKNLPTIALVSTRYVRMLFTCPQIVDADLALVDGVANLIICDIKVPFICLAFMDHF